MENKYSILKLREIYRKLGGEGSPELHKFFRDIDNNYNDEHAALIELATSLTEFQFQVIDNSMKEAEKIFNPEYEDAFVIPVKN